MFIEAEEKARKERTQERNHIKEIERLEESLSRIKAMSIVSVLLCTIMIIAVVIDAVVN